MARYRSRTRPFYVLTPPEPKTQDRKDSGIQLDEPSYPVAKQPEKEEVVSMRHGVTITKIPKPNLSEISSMVHSPRQRNMSSDIKSVRTLPENSLTRNNVNSITAKTESLKLCKKQSNDGLPKRLNTSENVDKSVPDVKVMVSADEDVCLEIRDSCSSPSKGDNSYKDTLKVESGEDSSEDSSESENAESENAESENAENSMIEGGCSETSDKTSPGFKSVQKPHKIHREHKKRKFRDLLPALKRSQSVGCESDMAPDHALFLQSCPGLQPNKTETDNADPARRMIHKTCSADAAMMAGEVLPLDPQDLVRSKQKSSIARNMKKKLQALKRRNTDSLLGAAIMTVRGTSKVTQSDAVEWGNSFESLLSDKNGIEMFRSFLKSEFSEENIEFWSACEEFKNIRTNKLAARAQKIYSDFIAIKAPKQVNLDSKTRLGAVTSLESPTRDMFKQAQKRIQYLMENDSYKRFLESDPYRQLLGNQPLPTGR